MRLLLLTPPMTQLNTPYPATAYLMGFLRLHAGELGLELAQADPALELFLRLYSRDGLTRVRDTIKAGRRRGRGASAAVDAFLAQAEAYIETVEAAVAFLQGRDPNLAARIAGRTFLPEGPRFAGLAQDDEDEGPLA